MEDLLKYLDGMVWLTRETNAAGYYEWLRQGRQFTGRLANWELDEFCKRWRKQYRPKIKECFHNAQTLVLSAALEDIDTLTYHEGYCFPGIIPVEHGWVVDAEGRVIDMTMDAADKKCGVHTVASIAYVGHPVPTEMIRKAVVHTGMTMPLLPRVWELQQSS